MIVLLVEDDLSIARPLTDVLQTGGFDVTHVTTGASALEAVNYDVVLLDLGLPDMDGQDVCRELRKTTDAPIIMLTARGDEIDRIVGLEIGADDYVTKPFSSRELLARIRAVTRRLQAATTGAVPAVGDGQWHPDLADVDVQAPQEVGVMTIDRRTRRVFLRNEEITLTAKEFDLLAYLATDPGAVKSRSDLIDNVWDTNWYGPTKTIDVHIAALRKKLGSADWIEVVRGVGFRLEPQS
jgi:two-component system response regulator RegX3